MARIAKESWVLVAICTADLVTTIWLVTTGLATEGNPLMNHYLEQGVLVFIAAKALLVAGPLIVLEWARRSRPAFVHSMMRATIVMYLGIYGVGVLRLNSHAILGGGLTPQDIAVREWARQPITPEEMAYMREMMRSRSASVTPAGEQRASLPPAGGGERAVH
ncbi:MAG TPA: DUF5658 family protein [Chthonomonadales bacterium]|nr:DUF5658 family protein [Chthonomonadales bacterium]